MSTPTDVIAKIVEVLRDNLTDPNENRVNTDWISSNFTQISSQYPRISVTKISGPMTGKAVNSTKRRQLLRIQITVFSQNSNIFEIDGTEYGGSSVNDILSDKIIDLFSSEQSTLCSLDDVEYMQVIDDVKNTLSNRITQNNIDVEVSLIRGV